jgi:hypothetical protein
MKAQHNKMEIANEPVDPVNRNNKLRERKRNGKGLCGLRIILFFFFFSNLYHEDEEKGTTIVINTAILCVCLSKRMCV